MADKKFTDLTAAGVLAATDLLAIAQSPFGAGTSKSITGAVLLTFVGTTYFPKAGGDISGNTTIATNKILLNADGTSSFLGFMTTPFYLANFPDASTNTAPVVSEFSHSLTGGTAAANFGTSIDISMDSSTTTRQTGARISTIWTTATHATRTSRIGFFLANSATLTEVARLDAVGGLSVFQNGIGATPSDGLLLSNLTAATLGTTQNSPALRFTGRGWSTAFGDSRTCEFRNYVPVVQGVLASYSLVWESSMNGAAFTSLLSLTSSGLLTAAGTIISTTGTIVSSSLGFQSVSSSRLVAPADSVWTLVNNSNNNFNRLQFGGTTSSFPSIQRSSTILIARLADDSADTAIRATAFNIGANPLNVTYSAYSAGTVYTVTATAALIDFGTTDPSITIAAAGTYRLSGFVKVNLNAATFTGNRVITIVVRRTNNTAANISNSGTTFTTQIIASAFTGTYFIAPIKDIFYTTANTNDTLELWADINVLPDAGSVTVEQASISAIRVA